MGFEHDGWDYTTTPDSGVPEYNPVKLVSFRDSIEVGIRVWNAWAQQWMDGNMQETRKILAWKELPQRAQGFWQHGMLHIPAPTPKV